WRLGSLTNEASHAWMVAVAGTGGAVSVCLAVRAAFHGIPALSIDPERRAEFSGHSRPAGHAVCGVGKLPVSSDRSAFLGGGGEHPLFCDRVHGGADSGIAGIGAAGESSPTALPRGVSIRVFLYTPGGTRLRG